MSIAAANGFHQDARVIGLVGLAHAISHFFHLILAPLFPWLREAFQLSYAELGLLMTVFFVVSSIGQALAGFVVDRVGARAVLFFGVGMLAFSALVLAQAQSYAMLLAGSMLAGVGNSIFHPADLTLLNKRVSPGRLGHAFSTHGICGNLGWALAPVFLATLASLFDWRIALYAASALAALVLLVLVAHRELLDTNEACSSVQSASAGKSGQGGAALDSGALGFLRLRAVWMCFAFFLISAMALGGVQSFSSSSLRALYGMSLEWATAGYTGYMLASAAGMLWGGFLAGKAARHERTIALAFCVAGLAALLIAAGFLPAALAVALMGVMGFGAGIAGPSRDLMIRAAAPQNATGRVYGVVYSGLDTGLAVSPLLFGAVMDARYPAWVFIGIGLFQCLAIFTAFSIGNQARNRQLEVRPA